MKFLKRLLLFVVVLVVIVVAAPLIVVQILDPNDIKAEIAETIGNATGRTVEIAGDLELTAYPWLGARIGTTTIGNAPGFDSPYFAKFEQAEIRADLMGLLRQEMRMDTVSLSGVHMVLARKADGTTNWDDLTQASAGQSGDSGQPFSVLALGGINIINGKLDWTDALNAQTVSIADLAVATGPLDLSDLADARLETDVSTSMRVTTTAPAVASTLEAKTRATFDSSAQTLTLAGLNLKATANGAGIGGSVAGTLAGDVDIALEQLLASIRNLRLTEARVDQSGLKTGLTATVSTLSVAGNAFTADALNLKLAGLETSQGVSGDAEVTAGVKAQLDTRSVSLTQAKLKGVLAGGALGGKLPFDLTTDSVRFSGAEGSLAIVNELAKLANFDVAQTKGSATINGDIGYSLKTSVLVSNNLRAAANIAGRAVRGGKANLTLTGALRANLQGQSAAFSNLVLEAKDLNTVGVAGTAKATGNVTVNMKSQVVSAKKLLFTSNLSGANLPGGKLNGTLNLASSTLNVGKESLRVRQFTAKGMGLSATGGLNLGGFNGTPTYDGNINVAPFSPRKLLARLGETAPRTSDPKALQSASLSTFFSGTSALLKLKKTKVTVDQTTLRGSASIANLRQPNYKFRLRADRLNISRYLTPEDRRKAATPGAAVTAAATLPLETLRRFNANGSLAINDLRLAGLRVSKANVSIDAKNGLIRVTPARANLYGGTYAGNIRLDARGKTAQMSFDEKLTQVDVGALLTDLKGKPALTGTGTATAKLKTSGVNGQQLISALNGTTDFRIDNGTIRQIDIVRSICTLVENARGRGGETRFDALTGSAKIVNGVIENDALSVSSPLLRIGARGIVDVPRDALDYRGEVALVGTCKGQGGRVRGKLAGIDIPIRVTGSIANPRPSLDTGRVLEAVAQREIERKSERITKKLQEQVGEQAGKVLGETTKKVLPGLIKGLFGN